jgi:hypothetical protein
MRDSIRANLNGSVPSEAAKLTSLLALAAGAVTLPQTGHADIIFTSLGPSGYSVGFTAQEALQFVVPGTANVGFQRRATITYTSPGSLEVNVRFILAGDLGGGAGGGINGNQQIAANLPLGATWDFAPMHPNLLVARADDLNGQSPAAGFDHQYYAWYFTDDTLGGGERYGWVEVSLAMAGYNAGGPTLTIWSYAYDDSGLRPTMGQVPEPTSGALLALGAMALGARGVRKWRQGRKPADQI